MALTDSLISFWNLDETSGSRSDSWGTNPLASNNGVTSAAGKIGNAALFAAASSQFLSHADNASLNVGNGSFTVGAWVYANTLTTIGGRAAIVTKDGTDADRGFSLQYNLAANKFRFVYGNIDYSTVATADNTAPSTSTWYCVISWYDSVNHLIGISVNDNTAVTTALTITTTGSTGALYLGAAQRNNGASGEDFWDGRIDLAPLAKTVWSAADRTAFYNSGNGVSIVRGGALLMGSH